MKTGYGLTLQIGNCFNLILFEVRAGPQKVLTSRYGLPGVPCGAHLDSGFQLRLHQCGELNRLQQRSYGTKS